MAVNLRSDRNLIRLRKIIQREPVYRPYETACKRCPDWPSMRPRRSRVGGTDHRKTSVKRISRCATSSSFACASADCRQSEVCSQHPRVLHKNSYRRHHGTVGAVTLYAVLCRTINPGTTSCRSRANPNRQQKHKRRAIIFNRL